LLRRIDYKSVMTPRGRNAGALLSVLVVRRRQKEAEPMIENLLPLMIVAAIIFGVLWLAIETGVKVGDRIDTRRTQRTKARRDPSMRNQTR
jgi:hypothetical protein